MTKKEKTLMKHFKVEELEERLEMRAPRHWGCGKTGEHCRNPAVY